MSDRDPIAAVSLVSLSRSGSRPSLPSSSRRTGKEQREEYCRSRPDLFLLLPLELSCRACITSRYQCYVDIPPPQTGDSPLPPPQTSDSLDPPPAKKCSKARTGIGTVKRGRPYGTTACKLCGGMPCSISKEYKDSPQVWWGIVRMLVQRRSGGQQDAAGGGGGGGGGGGEGIGQRHGEREGEQSGVIEVGGKRKRPSSSSSSSPPTCPPSPPEPSAPATAPPLPHPSPSPSHVDLFQPRSPSPSPTASLDLCQTPDPTSTSSPHEPTKWTYSFPSHTTDQYTVSVSPSPSPHPGNILTLQFLSLNIRRVPFFIRRVSVIDPKIIASLGLAQYPSDEMSKGRHKKKKRPVVSIPEFIFEARIPCKSCARQSKRCIYTDIDWEIHHDTDNEEHDDKDTEERHASGGELKDFKCRHCSFKGLEYHPFRPRMSGTLVSVEPVLDRAPTPLSVSGRTRELGQERTRGRMEEVGKGKGRIALGKVREMEGHGTCGGDLGEVRRGSGIVPVSMASPHPNHFLHSPQYTPSTPSSFPKE
ncbi:hypothetical protein TREMEDRAFT_66485 [Tremella mesenterica DSM 1558]|uniref:uncharacterized protein n=1 Tax=Tremella mesenterica (strain ATCC 24925 / CBS 8224 / DSM 1558 / NBRC 9311 / NRRL Y-6157 / RJB 2259-6 / UBC 559-6) TaxID=578456 RepID=UPI00032C7089|nr:uncharacterized protein TREMEDRAFT_66485 [Tremella mesenterica DSM 1558]EIW65494.1 hypothetical protein TREMEDRAFT_66485 [Tremella mesenterica DSM 1558]